MKTWCIEFEREFEGKDVLHVQQEEKPTEQEAVDYIQYEGYHFETEYDEIRKIYEV